MEALRAEFAMAIEEAIQECYRINYSPIVWERMNRRYGPVEAAIKLVTSGDFQTGLTRLLVENRPELTVESHVLQSRFADLFSAQLRELAQWRLGNAPR